MNVVPLSDAEKAYFDTIRVKASEQPTPGQPAPLGLHRMTLWLPDGPVPVAMVATPVYAAEGGAYEGVMPLALIIDAPAQEWLLSNLRSPDDQPGERVDPRSLDPNR